MSLDVLLTRHRNAPFAYIPSWQMNNDSEA